MKTSIVLQVRLASQRLPNKALKSIRGKPLIRHIVERLLYLKQLEHAHIDTLIIATVENSIQQLKACIDDLPVQWHIGSEANVLQRTIDAATRFGAQTIIRATGDNPMVSIHLAQAILQIHRGRRADLSHFLGNPWGTGVEVIELAALIQSAQLKDLEASDYEHTTQAMYNRPHLFRIVEEQAPSGYCGSTCVTVDTREDLERAQKLWAMLPERFDVPDILRIYPW